MWYLVFLVISIILSDSREPNNKQNAFVHTRKEKLWWTGVLGAPGANQCPPGSRISKTQQKCVTTSYDLAPSGRGIQPETSQCEAGKRWSKSKQLCVRMIAGLRNPGGNSRRRSIKCAPGRRWSKSRRKCVKRSTKTKANGGPGAKWNSKSFSNGIGRNPPPPRPPPPRFSPGQLGK